MTTSYTRKQNIANFFQTLNFVALFQIRNHLDFLLTETHFTESDISSYPRVFINSLEKIKARLEELATLKYVPKRLYIICLEKKRYLQIIEKHCQDINDEIVWENFRKIERRIKEK